MSTKIIVSNRFALRAKHGTDFPLLTAALKRLVNADAARGLKTRVLFLDDKRSMRQIGGPVRRAISARENKRAIDAVFAAHRPDYLMILGAPDVVPHQALTNPLKAADLDPAIPSDLPYACEAGYGRDPSAFLGPTRVVGRVPDVHGASSAKYLVKLLDTAAAWDRWTSVSDDYFSITARVWESSTRQSLEKLFKASDRMLISPTDGPQFALNQWTPKIHFINCHGAVVSTAFFGEHNNAYPIAIEAGTVLKSDCSAVVASAECCYGADLFDSSLLPAGGRGVAEAYLHGGAYGFFGSSTVSYGAAAARSAADLITVAFLEQVRAGASTGRSVLEARQQYAAGTTDWSPFDLKTFAQFMLLGDPSIIPAPQASPSPASTLLAKSSVASERSPTPESLARGERRRALFARGEQLSRSLRSVPKQVSRTSELPAAIKRLAVAEGFVEQQPLVFERTPPAHQTSALVTSSAARKSFDAATTFYIFPRRQTPLGEGPVRIDALVAKNVAGQLVSAYYLTSR